MGDDAMYRFAALLLVVAVANSHAVGAIVQFSPESVGLSSGWNMRATFDVTVIPEVEGGFDTADIVFGSNYGLVMADFAYSDEWNAAFATVPPPMTTGIYASDLWISGNGPMLNDLPSLFAGTLTVDAGGLFFGDYYFGVDAGVDGFSSLGQRGVPDLAYGGAEVYVGIPEPSAVGLLALASLAVLRRRVRRP